MYGSKYTMLGHPCGSSKVFVLHIGHLGVWLALQENALDPSHASYIHNLVCHFFPCMFNVSSLSCFIKG